MEIEAVLARARSALGQGIRYRLGKGGMSPGSPTPASNGLCDCSGFVAWCLGMSRQTGDRFYVQFNGGWLETTAMWTDIGRNAGIFEPLTAPTAGGIIVFPDANGGHGHVGVLTSASTAIHCSKSNDTRSGDAVQETDLRIFGSNRRYGWLVGLH